MIVNRFRFPPPFPPLIAPSLALGTRERERERSLKPCGTLGRHARVRLYAVCGERFDETFKRAHGIREIVEAYPTRFLVIHVLHVPHVPRVIYVSNIERVRIGASNFPGYSSSSFTRHLPLLAPPLPLVRGSFSDPVPYRPFLRP